MTKQSLRTKLVPALLTAGIATLVTGCVFGLQGFDDNGDGFLAGAVPGVEGIQRTLGVIQDDVADIRDTTGRIEVKTEEIADTTERVEKVEVARAGRHVARHLDAEP